MDMLLFFHVSVISLKNLVFLTIFFCSTLFTCVNYFNLRWAHCGWCLCILLTNDPLVLLCQINHIAVVTHGLKLLIKSFRWQSELLLCHLLWIFIVSVISSKNLIFLAIFSAQPCSHTMSSLYLMCMYSSSKEPTSFIISNNSHCTSNSCPEVTNKILSLAVWVVTMSFTMNFHSFSSLIKIPHVSCYIFLLNPVPISKPL